MFFFGDVIVEFVGFGCSCYCDCVDLKKFVRCFICVYFVDFCDLFCFGILELLLYLYIYIYICILGRVWIWLNKVSFVDCYIFFFVDDGFDVYEFDYKMLVLLKEVIVMIRCYFVEVWWWWGVDDRFFIIVVFRDVGWWFVMIMWYWYFVDLIFRVCMWLRNFDSVIISMCLYCWCI